MPRKRSSDAPLDNETLARLYALVVRLVSPLAPLPVQGVDRIILLRPEEIAFIAPEKRGLKIVDRAGTAWPRYDKMVEIEARLSPDPRFYRSHRGFLINAELVRGLRHGSGSGSKSGARVFFRDLPDTIFAEVSEGALPALKKRLGF